MEKSLHSINKVLIVVKPLKLHFCVLEIPGSILAHKQANFLVHEISAGIIKLNSMTFHSLRISILLSFTKLLIFSMSYSYSLELRGLINITVWNSHPIYVCSNKQHVFFFYWCYNPLWVLFFSVIFFHSALSSHSFLHRLTPIICKSSSMPAIHLFCGLPLVLVPIGFHCNIFLGVLLSSIRITRPSQAILLLFINLTKSAFPISSFSS
jgi:hypothetical protein